MSKVETTAQKSYGTFVDSYYSKLQDFPLEDHFRVRDLPGHCHPVHKKLIDRGMVEKVERIENRSGAGFWWRFTDKARDCIRALDGSSSVLECGHTGFSNPRGRDGFECSTCGRELSRSDVERLG